MSQRLWYQQDANFNVTSVSNDAGAVTERYVYTPYGERTVLHSDFTPAAGGASLFGVDEGHQGLSADGVMVALLGTLPLSRRYFSALLTLVPDNEPLS